MPKLTEIAEKIRRDRILKDFTQSDVAELSGISLRTIRDMEKGSGQSSLANWQKVLDVLGLEFDIKTKKLTDAKRPGFLQ
jgi:transcriptional regulator with XRE-family HTH domain